MHFREQIIFLEIDLQINSGSYYLLLSITKKFMEKFHRIFFTLLIFLGIVIKAQNSITLEGQTPRYVHENGSSEIACVLYIETDNADSAMIRLSSEKITFGDTVTVKTDSSVLFLPVKKFLGEFVLGLDSSIVEKIKNRSVLLQIPFSNSQNDEINFEAELFENDSSIYKITSTETNDDGDYLSPLILNTFRPAPNKHKTLKTYAGSEFFFSVNLDSTDNFEISFWLEAENDLPRNAFTLNVSAENSENLTTLTTDAFGMLTFFHTCDAEIYEEYFLAPESWHHISLSFTENRITLLADDKKIQEKEHYYFFPEKINVKFENTVPIEIHFAEILCTAKIGEEKEEKKLFKTDFNKIETLEGENDINNAISANNCEISEKDFPVLISRPQININISSAYTTVEWFNDKDENVATFVLEKSLGFEDFVPIFTVETPELHERYYYDDYNTENASVMFYRVKQIDKNGEIVYSDQIKVGKAKINDFILNQNFPNPFNPSTTFSVEVIIPGYFEIAVYDLVGKEVQTLHKGTLTQGVYNFEFNAGNLPSGIYLLRVKSQTQTVVRKIIFAK